MQEVFEESAQEPEHHTIHKRNQNALPQNEQGKDPSNTDNGIRQFSHRIVRKYQMFGQMVFPAVKIPFLSVDAMILERLSLA
ncbi:MAG: hypothetical protein AAF363_07645 [Bacteroidota bacterium]